MISRPDLIPEYRARIAAGEWFDGLPGQRCRESDLNITSIMETVTLIERDVSPSIPRQEA